MKDDDVSHATGIDVAWGLAVAILVVFVCLLLGGFSFFAPWLIVTPAVMFSAGLIRGGTPGRIIVKGVALGALLLMLLVLGALRSPVTLLLGIPVILAPSVAGIATRRWFVKMYRPHLT